MLNLIVSSGTFIIITIIFVAEDLKCDFRIKSLQFYSGFFKNGTYHKNGLIYIRFLMLTQNIIY